MPSTSTIRLLKRLLGIVEQERIPVAIGGGIAVNVHGHARETMDIDAYFRMEDRLRIIRALREDGFIVDRLFAPNHYAAFPPRTRDVRRRIDLLFPEGDPELGAIEAPVKIAVERWGVTVPVFPVELLVIAKLIAAQDVEGARHAADVRALLELGAFEPGTVRVLLSGFEPELLVALDDIMRSFDRPVGADRRLPPSRRRKR